MSIFDKIANYLGTPVKEVGKQFQRDAQASVEFPEQSIIGLTNASQAVQGGIEDASVWTINKEKELGIPEGIANLDALPSVISRMALPQTEEETGAMLATPLVNPLAKFMVEEGSIASKGMYQGGKALVDKIGVMLPPPPGTMEPALAEGLHIPNASVSEPVTNGIQVSNSVIGKNAKTWGSSTAPVRKDPIYSFPYKEITDAQTQIVLPKNLREKDFKLSDILKYTGKNVHPILENYPGLDAYAIRFNKIGNNSIDPVKRIIYVNAPKTEAVQEIKNTLLHELTHAIQDIENWPSVGGNPTDFIGTRGLPDLSEREAHRAYNMLSGERQAFGTEARAHLTQDQLNAHPRAFSSSSTAEIKQADKLHAKYMPIPEMPEELPKELLVEAAKRTKEIVTPEEWKAYRKDSFSEIGDKVHNVLMDFAEHLWKKQGKQSWKTAENAGLPLAKEIKQGDTVYRGAISGELGKGDFPGTFVTNAKSIAKQYGPVHEFKISKDLNLLDSDTEQGEKLALEFFKQHPEKDLNDVVGALESKNPDDKFEALIEVYAFPDKEYSAFIKSKGYDGFITSKSQDAGNEFFIFDNASLQLAKESIPKPYAAPFYSYLEQTVQEKMPARMTGKDLQGLLTNASQAVQGGIEDASVWTINKEKELGIPEGIANLDALPSVISRMALPQTEEETGAMLATPLVNPVAKFMVEEGSIAGKGMYQGGKALVDKLSGMLPPPPSAMEPALAEGISSHIPSTTLMPADKPGIMLAEETKALIHPEVVTSKTTLPPEAQQTFMKVQAQVMKNVIAKGDVRESEIPMLVKDKARDDITLRTIIENKMRQFPTDEKKAIDEATAEYHGFLKGVKQASEPIKATHWTNAQFDKFDDSKIGSGQNYDDQIPGHWFTKGEFSYTPFGANKMEVELAISNPKVLKAQAYFKIKDKAAYRKKLETQGYDGVKVLAEPEWANGRGPSGTDEWGVDNYVAFKPEQIKVLKTTHSPRPDTIPYAPEVIDAPIPKPYAAPFYSYLEQSVQDKMPARMAGKDLQGLLTNAAVKKEELQYSGMDELFEKPMVTKQEVLDHLQANKIELKEITLGNAPKRITKEWEVTNADGNVVNTFRTEDEANAYIDELIDTSDKDISGYTVGAPGIPAIDSHVKFDEYQLPGGKNYKEMLFQLPQSKRVLELQAKEDAGKIPGGPWEPDRAELRALTKNDYQSSHFDEPNVLAHTRFNEVKDTQGKKVLRIEEIQSDWHQEGRDTGYIQPNAKFNPDILTIQELQSFVHKVDRNGYAALDETTKNDLAEMRALVKENVASGAWEVTPESAAGFNGVPDAPFKKNWYEMVMRRMIRYAAENGFDKVAWTTGEQQAKRYPGLIKAFDAIRAELKPNGTYNVYGVAKNQLEHRLMGNFPEAQLTGAVGKDLAQKIVQQKGGEFTGLDLKVGDHGMKVFYDEMLPSYVNKFTKKWGGQVVDEAYKGKADAKRYSELDVDELGAMLPKEKVKAIEKEVDTAIDAQFGKGTVRAFGSGALETKNPVLNDKVANFWGELNLKRLLHEVHKQDKTKNVYTLHTLSITPEMKRAALTKGFPLFSGLGIMQYLNDGKEEKKKGVQ